MVRTGIERDLRLSGGGVRQLDARPAIELAPLETFPQLTYQVGALVHPPTPPAA